MEAPTFVPMVRSLIDFTVDSFQGLKIAAQTIVKVVWQLSSPLGQQRQN